MIPETPCDRLFRYRDAMDRAEPCGRSGWWVVGICFGAFAAPWLVAMAPKPVQLTYMVGFGTACIWWTWARWRYFVRFNRYSDAMLHRLDGVPLRIQLAAQSLYGKEWELAAVECWEGHVAGDCPLCGAE